MVWKKSAGAVREPDPEPTGLDVLARVAKESGQARGDVQSMLEDYARQRDRRPAPASAATAPVAAQDVPGLIRERFEHLERIIAAAEQKSYDRLAERIDNLESTVSRLVDGLGDSRRSAPMPPGSTNELISSLTKLTDILKQFPAR
jgi:hypothetical protein